MNFEQEQSSTRFGPAAGTEIEKWGFLPFVRHVKLCEDVRDQVRRETPAVIRRALQNFTNTRRDGMRGFRRVNQTSYSGPPASDAFWP
jgi:hypothetical protein